MFKRILCACVLAGYAYCACSAQAKSADQLAKDAGKFGKVISLSVGTATTSGAVHEIKVPDTIDLENWYDATPLDLMERLVSPNGAFTIVRSRKL